MPQVRAKWRNLDGSWHEERVIPMTSTLDGAKCTFSVDKFGEGQVTWSDDNAEGAFVAQCKYHHTVKVTRGAEGTTFQTFLKDRPDFMTAEGNVIDE